MQIEQLEYIVEVAKQGTISKAAENLHISHSAISQAITNLETELGIPIFKRSRSGSICTEEGQAVIKLSYEIINKVLELKELGNKSNTLQGELRISSSPIFFSTFLPEALYSFKQQFPDIQIIINENSTENIIHSVRNFHFDIGFIFGTCETLKTTSTYLKSQSLLKPALLVAVSKDSPLAKNEVVTPKELLQHPLIIRDEGFAKKVWEVIFAKHGKGQVFFYSNNDAVIKNVIANNLAIGFTTDLIKHDPLVTNGDIVPIPYVDDELPELHFICIKAKNKYTSIIEREFLKHITVKLRTYEERANIV